MEKRVCNKGCYSCPLVCICHAPVYGEVYNSEIADSYDKIISCSSDVPEHHKEYIQYQIHRHSKSCTVGKARSCRFSFPKPPMNKTCILQPFTCEEQEDNERGKELWVHVKKLLNSYGLGTETRDTFEVMLQKLNMSYNDYILAVCSTIIDLNFIQNVIHMRYVLIITCAIVCIFGELTMTYSHV